MRKVNVADEVKKTLGKTLCIIGDSMMVLGIGSTLPVPKRRRHRRHRKYYNNYSNTNNG